MHARSSRVNCFRDAEHFRKDPLNLCSPRSGKERNNFCFVRPIVKPFGAKFIASLARCHLSYQRMAYPCDRNPLASVKIGFKFKEDDHMVNGPSNRVNPSATPRPDLRGDVINHGESPVDFFRKAKIEPWGVDQDNRIWLKGFNCLERVVKNASEGEIFS